MLKNTCRILAATLCVAAVFIVGCADQKNISPIPSIDPSVKANLRKPVNCATAKQDIATLEAEKASVGKQVLSGVRAVMPIAAVVGLLSGDYNDRTRVAVGEYNQDIEKKIRQIRVKCDVM